MPSNKGYSCGSCHENISRTQPSVQCKGCEQWHHVPCAGLNDKALVLLKDCKQLNYSCKPCSSNATGLNIFRKEMGALNSKLDSFIEKSVSDHLSISKVLSDTVASFKSEMAACFKEMKSEIIDCNKLINHIDASTTKKNC